MPLYEYLCKQCKRLTERIVKFSDPPLTVCPHCGGEMEQTISAPAVQFKGSGWYVTDYAKSGKGGKPEAGSSAKSGETSSSSSETKSDNTKSDSSKSDGSKSEPAKSESSVAKDK